VCVESRDDLTCSRWKEFQSCFHTSHERDAVATLTYLFLGTGKLDPEDIRKTHPTSVLTISKAVGRGEIFPRDKTSEVG
jgi:hypothetical protein